MPATPYNTRSFNETRSQLITEVRRLVASWMNGNRSYVITTLSESMPATSVYTATAIYSRLPDDEKSLYLDMLRDSAENELGPLPAADSVISSPDARGIDLHKPEGEPSVF